MVDFFERHALRVSFVLALLLFGFGWLDVTLTPELAAGVTFGWSSQQSILFYAVVALVAFIGLTLVVLSNRGHIRWSNTR